MSPENVKLTIIGGMVLLCGLVFLIPSTARNRAKQGSTSNSAVEDAANSVKSSINSLGSSNNVIFGKSKSSSYGSKGGGSKKHCKKGGKRKTKCKK